MIEAQLQDTLPFWKKYKTPIFDREELHKTTYGVLNDFDFAMHYTSMIHIDELIVKARTHDRYLKKLRNTNLTLSK